jgi:protein-disulfide isomerase
VSLARSSRNLALSFAVALSVGAAASAAVPAHEPDDMALGSPKARVAVIEYASVGCPHCAAWNNDVWPAFKAKYVTTGRVRFVVREMLTGEPTVALAGFMLARCAGPAKYFPVVEAIYRRQASMFEAGAAPEPILRDIAKTAGGMTDAAFDACLGDDKGRQSANARAERHTSQDGVNSTPTFFVNGQRFEGELTLAQFSAAIHTAAAPARRR